MITEFPHRAPKGMHYEQTDFKRNVVAIWIHYDRRFDYNLGDSVRCIWGFYDFKKCQFYAPVNSKDVGKPVEFKNTRNYTAMPLKQTVLESCFV